MKRNKNKFIISAIAGVLMLGSIAAGYGLYKKVPADQHIDIGINTSADLNLQATIVQVGESFLGTTTAPVTTIKTQNIDVSFWGDKTGLDQSGYTQDVVVGKAFFEFHTSSEALKDRLAVAITNSYNEGQKWGATQTLNAGDWDTTSGYKKTWSNDLAVPVAAAASGGLPLRFALSINLINEETEDQAALAIAGATYTINVKFKVTEDYVYSYVVGIDDNWHDFQDKFQMVPNLKSDAYEWMYVFKEALGTQTFKARQNADWSRDNMTKNIQIGDALYWAGGDGIEAFYAVYTP